jgi:hypothetical protein
MTKRYEIAPGVFTDLPDNVVAFAKPRTLPLTEKQERVWLYLRSCRRSPSYREMERDLNTSIGRLNDLVVALKEKGFVTFRPSRHRSIVALDPRNDLTGYPTEALQAELARRLAQ